MKASLVLRRRFEVDAVSFAELVIWSLPQPVPPSEHPFKYRMVLIHKGERVLGFDNERGKGDQRHDGSVDTPYAFQGVEQLVADFLTAIERWKAAQ
jgi:hypothetical protein